MKISNRIALARSKGASGMEFGLVVGLVAVVAVAAAATVGGKVREIFGGSANAMALGLNPLYAWSPADSSVRGKCAPRRGFAVVAAEAVRREGAGLPLA